ncbi:MAG: ABC transporter substrate-binding protein [Rhodococcus sp. (in: high G+C Gram-positive bacteria)]
MTACATETEPTTDARSSAESVTVEHVAGETTIEGVPQRIVAIGSQWLDALAEFDVEPVGYYSAGAMGDDRGLYPWQQDVSTEAQSFDVASTEAGATVPTEEIAALEPDLILVSGVRDVTPFTALSSIAPVVLPKAAKVETWQSQTTTLGRILGREDDAARIIAEGNMFTDQVKEEHPGLAGKTAVLSQYIVANQQLAVVVDPEDGASSVFSSLGMTLPADLVALPDVKNGRLMLSPERVEVLTADLAIVLPNGGTREDLDALPGFGSLPSVRSGALSVVDYATVVGFNTPSKASVTYSLGRIEPQLDAAGKTS